MLCLGAIFHVLPLPHRGAIVVPCSAVPVPRVTLSFFFAFPLCCNTVLCPLRPRGYCSLRCGFSVFVSALFPFTLETFLRILVSSGVPLHYCLSSWINSFVFSLTYYFRWEEIQASSKRSDNSDWFMSSSASDSSSSSVDRTKKFILNLPEVTLRQTFLCDFFLIITHLFEQIRVTKHKLALFRVEEFESFVSLLGDQ